MGRSGLYDWFMQRVSAVILLSYTVFIAAFLVMNGDVTYLQWQQLFSNTGMRIYSLLALLALGSHAWVGLWAVFTDYFTERLLGTFGNVIRFVLQVVCALTMFIYVIWGIQILWG